jgi:1-acyl-sn-glycerol-3-phosphate acyltransferase
MFLVWFVKITSAPILLLYYKLKLRGKKRAGKIRGKTIIIANHTSTMDAVLVNYIFPTKRIYFMTADRMFTFFPIFSWFLKTLGAFPTRRDKADLSAVALGSDILKKGKILGIFPEGKRSLDGHMLKFKPGVVMLALNNDAPIIPIYHTGEYGFFHQKKALVGERIFLHDYCSEKHPSEEQIRALVELLEQKMEALKMEAEAL